MSRAYLYLLFGLLIPSVALAITKDPPVDDKHWTTKYDEHFRKYAKHYFGPNVDWRWFKAQGIAESGLNPKAKSSAGALGIMQILPSTFAEIQGKNPHLVDIQTPRWNIAAGIYYGRQMHDNWSEKELPKDSRISLTFASYNAGAGGMRRAYRKAKEEKETVRSWADIAPHAPAETRRYVSRIHGLMKKP